LLVVVAQDAPKVAMVALAVVVLVVSAQEQVWQQ
jgi:hypothetical protein